MECAESVDPAPVTSEVWSVRSEGVRGEGRCVKSDGEQWTS